jgi:hypothetical protein
MKQREVYRHKDGRFASRRELWNGPPKPQHIVAAEWRSELKRFGERLREQICAPNALLEALRAR